MSKKVLVCAIYNHPEAYPPTLNAITQLSSVYDDIYILCQPNLPDQWQYPANVTLIKNGGNTVVTVKEQASLSTVKKIMLFLSFTYKLLTLVKKHKANTVLVYDPLPLFSYFLASNFCKKPQVVWYHNHDVNEEGGKKSIGGFAARYEKASFQKLDIFSLPADERRQYFPMDVFKGNYFFIPNYPSVHFYSRFTKTHTPHSDLKLIYQGSISNGHGIEELIAFIAQSSRNISFTLIGNVHDEYKAELSELKQRLNVDDKVRFLAPVNYTQLPPITMQHDVGIAIHVPHNLIYATGGTASNKIYEYAAAHLPILYFDSEHYRHFLGAYKWAFATNMSYPGIEEHFAYITAHLNELSDEAFKDFSDKLNFENVFSPIKNHLQAQVLNK